MKYYIIAGEASGDLHGSNLMRGLLAHDPSCEIRFWGGDRMAAVGGTLVRDYRDNAVMGLVEVIGRLGSILSNLRFCKQDILGWKPDAVILIDYPGFNLKIARFAHEHGFKVFYYIPPKVWARGEGRIRLLKKYVDRTFIIFPFEVPYFEAKGVSAVYNGNPLVDNIAATPSVNMTREEFLRSHSLTDDGRELIALLAGSRKMEVDYLLPRLAAAPSIDRSYYDRYLHGNPDIDIIYGDTYGVLCHSAAAAISSGTASLEAAVIGTPQVVCYGMNPITYAIARMVVRSDYDDMRALLGEKDSARRTAADIERLIKEK